MGDTDPNSSASIGGQAPTGEQGQAPTTGQHAQAAATTPQSAADQSASQQQQPASGLTPEQYAAEVARLSKELGDTRREAAQHRTELKKFQDAQLTDQQKLEKRAADAEAQLTTYQQRIATYEVKLAAQALGIIDPDLAALAIQAQLKYGEDGTPTNARELLQELVKSKPYLLATGQAGAPGQQQRGGSAAAAASSGGATNPGAGARTGTFTKAQIQAMSPREYAANREAIMRQLAAEKGRL